jgi:hypothetical protein
MKNAHYTYARQDVQQGAENLNPPAPPAAAAPSAPAPAGDQLHVHSYDPYPFVDRCCTNKSSCCDGIWSGYSRPLGCLHSLFHHCKHACGHRLFGNHCGCDCCYGGTFAGGCGNCGGAACGGWGLPRLGLHHHCGCGLLSHVPLLGFHRCNSMCSTPSGCQSCGNGMPANGHGNGHGHPSYPLPPEPVPATEGPLQDNPPPPPSKSAALPLLRGFGVMSVSR